MSTPERAGWYDDPEDASKLRYFDGIVWTENRVPRGPSITPRESATPTGQGEVPQAANPGAPPPSQAPAGPPQPGSGRDVYGRPVEGARPPHQPQGHLPYGHQPYQAGWGPESAAPPATADGQPLAGYGQRVVAHLVDVVIVGIITLLASGWAWWRFIADYWTFVMEAATEDPSVVESLTIEEVSGYLNYQYFFIALAIALVVLAIYNIGFLVARSATPGKMMVGISVRRTDRPGRLSVGTAFMRMLLPLGLRVLWAFTCLFELVVRSIDLLWPLKDARRQALHDKIAGTQVVVGKQPPRGSDS